MAPDQDISADIDIINVSVIMGETNCSYEQAWLAYHEQRRNVDLAVESIRRQRNFEAQMRAYDEQKKNKKRR